jgi:hypothetical protein
MSQPHGAWIKGKVTADIQIGEDAPPDWFDVLTVVCDGCIGNGAAGQVAQLESDMLTGTNGEVVTLDIVSA